MNSSSLISEHYFSFTIRKFTGEWSSCELLTLVTSMENNHREATSNDPWGPETTLLHEIADASYNVVTFGEIMEVLWKRINDDGKNWRHVMKSLSVLECLAKTGCEKYAEQCKKNIYAIETLSTFQYIEIAKIWEMLFERRPRI